MLRTEILTPAVQVLDSNDELKPAQLSLQLNHPAYLRGLQVKKLNYPILLILPFTAHALLGGGGPTQKKSIKKSKSISGILGWVLTFFDPNFKLFKKFFGFIA